MARILNPKAGERLKCTQYGTQAHTGNLDARLSEGQAWLLQGSHL